MEVKGFLRISLEELIFKIDFFISLFILGFIYILMAFWEYLLNQKEYMFFYSF